MRELARQPEAGATSPLTFVGHAYGPDGAELVVAERYRNLSPMSRDALLADVKRTAGLRFPNLAQVQDAGRSASDVFVTTAFVEGELLGALRLMAKAADRPLSIDVGIRVVVDVLAALSALHTDKTTPGQPPLVHGAVAPHTVAVGFDGVSRLLRPYVGRLTALNLDAAIVPYAAPEQLRSGKGSARADIYSVGVILWEILANARLFEKATREARLTRASTPLPKLTLEGDQAWAAPLIPIVEKALAVDPLARYGTAAEMAAAVRLAVRAKLAMPARVAEIVDRYGGEKILARRGELALPTPSSGDRRSVRPSVPDGASRVLAAIRPSSRPPTPTPAAVAPVVVPKAAAIPKAAAAPPAIAKPPAPHAGPRPAIGAIELSPAPPAVDEFDAPTRPRGETVDQFEAPTKPRGAPVAPPSDDEIELIDAVESVRAPVVAAAPPPPVVVEAPPPPVAAPAPAPAPDPPPLEMAKPELTSAPALATPDPVAVPAEDIPAGLPPPGRRKWMLALLLLIPLLVVVVFFAVRKPDGGLPPQGSTTATTHATVAVPPPPSTTAAVSTAEPLPTTTTTTTSTGTTAVEVDAAAPAVSGTSTGGPWPRPSSSTARPKPTYDPEGI